MARTAKLPSQEDRPFGCPPDACSCGKVRIHTFMDGKPICRKCFAKMLKGAVPKTRGKFGNTPTEVDGIKFHSKMEARRWLELRLLEQTGSIRNLERQVPFEVTINGRHICNYFADAVYFEDGKRVVEDTKGARTGVYRLKKKLVEAFYGVTIKEVTA